MCEKDSPNCTSLQKATLDDASLKGAKLHNAHLEGASLKRTTLQLADLTDAHLEAANLDGAQLHGAELNRSYFYGASLKGAQLHGADLSGAHLEGASLDLANFWHAKLEPSAIHLCGLRLVKQKLVKQEVKQDQANLEVKKVIDDALKDTSGQFRRDLKKELESILGADGTKEADGAKEEDKKNEEGGKSDETCLKDLKDFVLELVCNNNADAPYVARGLIVNNRIQDLGSYAKEVEAKFLDKSCQGAAGLTSEEKRWLHVAASRAARGISAASASTP